MTSTSPLNDPSVPDPGGACFYLDLPRELRDMIHAYALTYEDGLICAPSNICWSRDESLWVPKLEPARPHERPPKQDIDGNATLGDPNTLRLVCHQTRAETCGLLLKSNNISFNYRREYGHEVEQCCDCPRSCPRKSVPLVRDVYCYGFWNGIDKAEVFRSFYRQCSEISRHRLHQVTINRDCYAFITAPEAHDIPAYDVQHYYYHENILFALGVLRFDGWLRLYHYPGVNNIVDLVCKDAKGGCFTATFIKRGKILRDRMQEALRRKYGSTKVPENVKFLMVEEYRPKNNEGLLKAAVRQQFIEFRRRD